MIDASTLHERAERLDTIRSALADILADARDLVSGLGPITDRARAWLLHWDRATGTEHETTIDDTVAEMFQAAELAGRVQ